MPPTTATPKVGDQITDLAVLESVPIGGGVVDDCGDLYQRRSDGDWHGALIGGDNDLTDESLITFAPLLVVWLPKEAA